MNLQEKTTEREDDTSASDTKFQLIFGMLVGGSLVCTISVVQWTEMSKKISVLESQLQQKTERVNTLEDYLQGYKEAHLGSK